MASYLCEGNKELPVGRKHLAVMILHQAAPKRDWQTSGATQGVGRNQTVGWHTDWELLRGWSRWQTDGGGRAEEETGAGRGRILGESISVVLPSMTESPDSRWKGCAMCSLSSGAAASHLHLFWCTCLDTHKHTQWCAGLLLVTHRGIAHATKTGAAVNLLFRLE